mmetsp:Transcript_19844/g.51983  ORF Transcript_19844/g.51983 Transcript_19844/m.51983 type:complete len:85 (+) Transcript_19844:14-268(+)
MSQKTENYCHRMGRTGRAGKDGLATTLLTDENEEVMYDLKAYLESTDSAVPPKLANHAAAKAPWGSIGENGKVVGQKRDSVQYL